MDPLTVIATAGTVSKGVFTCVTSLYNFIQSATVVNDTINSLYTETHTLQRLVNSITTTVQQSSNNSNERLPLWQDVNNYLFECQTTTYELEATLVALHPGDTPVRSNIMKDAFKQFRLDLREDEIKRFRDQIHTHVMALNTTLQVITLHFCSTGPDAIYQKLDPLIRDLRSMIEDKLNNPLPTDTSSQSMNRNHRRLRESAKMVADHATVIMGSGSSRWDGSEPELPPLPNIKSPHRLRKQSETTGSEFGEPLRPEARDAISSWLKQGASGQEDDDSPAKIGSNESRTTDDTFSSGTATLIPHEDFGSDEEELEVEMLQRILALSREKLKTGNHAKAETMLRKALGKAQTLGKKAKGVDHAEISLDIARACFLQDKFDQVQETCGTLVKDTPVDDQDRVRLLEASHLLAQVYLCKGRYDDAVRQGKQTLAARRRLEGNSTAYYESVALLVTVYERKGSEDDVMIFESLLPADYVRPDFKGPATEATKVDVQAAASKVASVEHEQETYSPPLTESALHTMETANAMPKKSPPPVPAKKFDADLGIRVRPLPPPEPPVSLPASDRYRMRPIHEDLPHDTGSGPSERLPPETPSENADLSNNAGRQEHYRDSPTPTRLARPAPEPSLSRVKSSAKPSRSVSDPVLKRQTSLPNIPSLAAVSRTLLPLEQEEALRILRTNGKPPEDKYFDCSAALLWAAEWGHELVVRLLLQGWANQVKKKTLGFTSRDMVFRKGVYVDTRDTSKSTPLHLAARYGHHTICQILLERGASSSVRRSCLLETCPILDCKLGSTALELAIQHGQVEVVRTFVAKSADLSSPMPGIKNESSTLHMAAAMGNKDIVALLLAGKVSPTGENPDGATPLHTACLAGYEKITKIFLEQGVPIEARDKSGSTALQHAVGAGQQECVELLVEHGADVHARDEEKMTLLHTAAVAGQDHLVTLLLGYGVDMEARESKGGTALHMAAALGRPEIAKKLISNGADVAVRDYTGQTALHFASQFGQDKIIEDLLDAGLDVNGVNQEGQTALMLAAEFNHPSIVDILIVRDAHINLKDYDGKTAMARAITKKSREVATSLKLAGATYCPCAQCEGVLAGYDIPSPDLLDRYPDPIAPWSSARPLPLPSSLGFPYLSDPYLRAAGGYGLGGGCPYGLWDPLDDPLRLPGPSAYEDYPEYMMRARY